MANRTSSAGNVPPSNQLEIGPPYEVLSENVGFLEAVVGSVQFAADAKRHQLVRGYSNETLASTVRAVNWLEGRQRLDQLRELPAESLAAVVAILERELAVGTVEQIEELLTPAVRVLRDDLEQQKWPRKLARELELPAKVMLATGPPYNRETCVASAVLYFDARDQSRFIAPLDWTEVDRYSLERGIRRRRNSGEAAEQLDRELVQLEKHLPRETKPVDGWEGPVPSEPFEDLAAVDSWLGACNASALLMRDCSTLFIRDAAMESAKQALRNAHRLLDHLGQSDFPDCETEELPNVHAAEQAIAKLRRWIKSRAGLENDSNSKSEHGQPVLTGSDSATETPNGFLGGTALADALGIHPSRREAFFQRLMRQRLNLGDDCWHEVREPRPNSARFLYQTNSPKVRDLAAKYKTPKLP